MSSSQAQCNTSQASNGVNNGGVSNQPAEAADNTKSNFTSPPRSVQSERVSPKVASSPLYRQKYVLEECLLQNKHYLLRAGREAATGRRLAFKFTTSHDMYIREKKMLSMLDSTFTIPIVDSYEDWDRSYFTIVLDWDPGSCIPVVLLLIPFKVRVKDS